MLAATLPSDVSAAYMDTIVTLHLAQPADDGVFRSAADRAFGWFRMVETACSRFDPASEVLQLTRQAGNAVAVSALLFEAVRFALALARQSGGAFDPTIGGAQERRGFAE